MPRGNDTEGNLIAEAAMRNQYGIYSNADELIRSNQTRFDPAVQKALLLAVDEEATKELRKEGLSAVTEKFELAEGEEVVDFAVRGNALVAAVEDAQGNLRKVVTGFNEDYKEPELTPEQQAARAQAEADQMVAAETARLRAEADAKIAEVEAEEAARVAEEIAKVQEEAAAQVAEAQEAAAAEAESGSPASEPDAPKATTTKKASS